MNIIKLRRDYKHLLDALDLKIIQVNIFVVILDNERNALFKGSAEDAVNFFNGLGLGIDWGFNMGNALQEEKCPLSDLSPYFQ